MCPLLEHSTVWLTTSSTWNRFLLTLIIQIFMLNSTWCIFFDTLNLMSYHFYTNKDIDMWSFVLLAWPQCVLFDMWYIIIWSMVVEIHVLTFLSRGHDSVLACKCDKCTLFWQFLSLGNAIELSIMIVLDPHMILHFNTIEASRL